MDNPGETAFNLLAVLFLVFLNGFFVAAEFAMVKIRSSRLAQLVEEGNKKAKVAQTITNNLDAYLSATQFGITLASLGLGWIGESAIAHLIEKPLATLGVPAFAVHTIAFVIAFATITILHIVLGELAPKSLAIQRAEGTVLHVARPMILFYKVMYPFIWILNGTANRVLKWVGIQPAKEGELAHTEEEIRILMNQSHQSGLIDNTEMALFDNVFEFSDRIAREIMVPRVDMITIDIDDSHEEIIQKIDRERHTRYPVSQGDKDHIIGYVHVKDLYLQMNRHHQFTIQSILRRVIMVSEAAEISAVLKQMQKNGTQIAVVMDEYGGTAGLITTEDIMEELVGEIRDEFDGEELPAVQKTKDGYSVEGRVLLEEINDLLGTDIDDVDVDTIGGWMYSMVAKQPEKGDSARKSGFLFTIEKMDDTRIERISIQRLPELGLESVPNLERVH
ncbi:hemolysin family protein [Effusibacillus dendaii]|uniref:Membrane protein n=1 Tax=Effusibacillus dendaii TaxID=2743772 RepID=A0A7I8D9X2_9BACL|nr:hemolysin family protein [Effusibacillus dendaii]BCJ86914.1 membrane protein [Effusibacillus dendaii]